MKDGLFSKSCQEGEKEEFLFFNINNKKKKIFKWIKDVNAIDKFMKLIVKIQGNMFRILGWGRMFLIRFFILEIICKNLKL